jgi:hypothetical protein
LVGAVAVPLAQAQTAWRGFGYTNVNGRGGTGSVWADVESVTSKDPTAIRFTVGGTAGRTTTVNWDISCWNGTQWYTGPTFSSATLRVQTPWTKTVSSSVTGGVSSWNYCEVDVTAYRFDSGGQLTVKLEAQY